MMILAFDTSTEACTVAVWRDGDVLERFERHSQHSEHLLAMVDSLLAEAGVQLTQLDAIAFGRGPGSFTGLRIGAGVAQGLAFAVNLPVIPVSSLMALAQGVEGNKVLAAFDARMGQVYWGAYERNAAGRMQPVQSEGVMNPDVVPFPETGRWIGAGPGWDVYATKLSARLGAALERHQSGIMPMARHVAELAISSPRLKSEDAIPVYLRDDVATRKVKVF